MKKFSGQYLSRNNESYLSTNRIDVKVQRYNPSNKADLKNNKNIASNMTEF